MDGLCKGRSRSQLGSTFSWSLSAGTEHLFLVNVHKDGFCRSRVWRWRWFWSSSQCCNSLRPSRGHSSSMGLVFTRRPQAGNLDLIQARRHKLWGEFCITSAPTHLYSKLAIMLSWFCWAWKHNSVHIWTLLWPYRSGFFACFSYFEAQEQLPYLAFRINIAGGFH